MEVEKRSEELRDRLTLLIGPDATNRVYEHSQKAMEALNAQVDKFLEEWTQPERIAARTEIVIAAEKKDEVLDLVGELITTSVICYSLGLASMAAHTIQCSTADFVGHACSHFELEAQRGMPTLVLVRPPPQPDLPKGKASKVGPN